MGLPQLQIDTSRKSTMRGLHDAGLALEMRQVVELSSGHDAMVLGVLARTCSSTCLNRNTWNFTFRHGPLY